MREKILPVVTILAALTPALPAPAQATGAPHQAASPGVSVSAQGLIRGTPSHLDLVSPGGTYRMRIVPRKGGFNSWIADLTVVGPEDRARTLAGIAGNAFFVADLGRIVALDAAEPSGLASRITVYDLNGRALAQYEAVAPANPALSPDGGFFACATRDGLLFIDLASLDATRDPRRFDLFAAGPAGRLVGVVSDPQGRSILDISAPDAVSLTLPPGTRPRRIAFARDGSSVLLAGARTLDRYASTGGSHAVVLYEAPRGAELMDLNVTREGILLGMRTIENGAFVGWLVRLDSGGRLAGIERGPSLEIPEAEGTPPARVGIAWPIRPDAQHPVGNTYGEYQNYGGAPYPHPGIDVMGTPGQPVYAVRGGVVKAILTTAGEWHWRVAIGDSVTAGTCKGYLYAHLEQSSIPVHVGDLILQGQFIGNLVEWPIYNFTHCHFARIQDSGTTWDGYWLNTENPHLDIANMSETDRPVFEPARGSDLLAFCSNQTSTYQNPTALHGAVDIIAHVGDRIATTWVCAVQEIRYTIYPVGMPGYPIVNDKLSVYFDMPCDTYQNGQIDALLMNLLYKDDATCNTQGDYDYREFFHIITNSNGDQSYDQSDLNEAWDTTALPDRGYVIRVRASDAVGNATVDSMVVTTANGNPSDVAEAAVPRLILSPSYPNPAMGSATFTLSLPARRAVALAIYEPSGRLLRTLIRGDLEAGTHTFRWDGTDAGGRPVASGTYLYRLDGAGAPGAAKLTWIR